MCSRYLVGGVDVFALPGEWSGCVRNDHIRSNETLFDGWWYLQKTLICIFVYLSKQNLVMLFGLFLCTMFIRPIY